MPGRLGTRRERGRLDRLARVLVDQPGAQEDAPHLDVVGDLPALSARELDAEVPREDLDRHDRLLAPDAVERRQPLGHLEHVRRRSARCRDASPSYSLEQPPRRRR